MMRLPLLACLVATVFSARAGAIDKKIDITVSAGKHDYANTPVTVPLSLPKDLAGEHLAVLEAGTQGPSWGQLTAPSLLTEGIKPAAANLVRRDLHLIVPSLKAGHTLAVRATISPATRFSGAAGMVK